jgi:hypothetical protein
MSALELPGGATKKQRITLSGGTDRVTARMERFLHSHVQRAVSSRLTIERNGESIPYGFYSAGFKEYLEETAVHLRFPDITCDNFRYRVNMQTAAARVAADYEHRLMQQDEAAKGANVYQPKWQGSLGKNFLT